MVLKSHPICDKYFSDYFRIAYLSPEDPQDVRDEYYRRARIAHNELVKLCTGYYEKFDSDAELICKSLDIYRLHEACVDYFSLK
mgnify:CR=1 FL=1